MLTEKSLNRLATVSENHILIYSLIENSGGSGAWLRPLESKSNLHTGVVRRCLKELLVLRVITEIKSADTSKKTYISADVKPDAKHIGGGFMDEGKFDEGMIDVLTYVAVQFLQEKGWHKQDIRVSDERDPATSSSTAKHKSKTPAPKSSKPTTKDQPAITIDDSTITPAPAPVSAPAPPKERKLYPSWVHQRHPLIPQHPNYYTRYPTTLDVMFHMNENGALKDVVLTLKDTEQLLAKMQFDGYVERMRDPSGELHMKEPRWRASKRVWKMDTRHEGNQHFGFIEPAEGMVLPGNGLSQVPCARCPVKARCKPGGVVSPEECKYLEDWLSF